MGSIAKYRKRKTAILTAALVATAYMPTAWALPSGVVHKENVKISDDCSDIELTGDKGVIKWEKFGIKNGETVTFHRATPGWMVLNKVVGNDSGAIAESIIDGALNGKGGTVFLVNPSGIVFTARANVDVGSLVASTMDVKQDGDKFIFTKNDNNTSAIKIEKNAAQGLVGKITANDGYVAMFAHKIYNDGIITAPEVAMASGNEITLSYDDKINLSLDIDVLKNATATNDKNAKNNNTVILEDGLITTGSGYVLMTKDTADNVIGHKIINDSIITNSGSIVATGIGRDENGNPVLVGGNISMTAAKVLVDGSLSAKGGDVTTTGYDVIQVNDTAKVRAATAEGKAGTWNVNGKNMIVGTKISDSTWNKGKVKESNVSNEALNEALTDTNVNLLVSPQMKEYYADIKVEQPITKSTGDKTKLTLSAGRSISVEADIKSTDAAGALDITLNASDKQDTNSERGDGAVIMKGNIETNGGDFATTGKLGTYFGLIKPGDVGKVERYVKTKGGNITLGGEEVLLATGGEVLLDTTNPSAKGEDGEVIIEGEINSANSYYDKESPQYISWSDANEKANEYYLEAGTAEGTTHLAVITSALEDAVSNATMNQDFSKSKEAYVGGHVVAVETNEDGSIKYVNGLPVVKKDDNGNVITIVNDVTNTKAENNEHRKGGWYVATRDDDGKATSYVRFWAWTVGDEAGKIIYKQTAGENVAVDNGYSDKPDGKNGAGNPGFHDMPDYGKNPQNDQEKKWLTEPHGEALNGAYVNFAPNEPNDGGGRTEGSETALAVNHDTYFDAERGNVLVSKWDDMPDGSAVADSEKYKTQIKNYVVETEIGKSSLHIKAGDTLLKGKVGNLSKLNNLTIESTGNVDMKGSVQLVNDMSAKTTTGNVTAAQFIEAGNDVSLAAKRDVTAKGAITAGGKVTLSAGGDIVSSAITAGDKIYLRANGDVTLNDTLKTSLKHRDDAIVVRSHKRFLNNAEDSANVLQVGKDSHWKVYSETPYADNFGSGVSETGNSTAKDLNSDSFAVWGWDGKSEIKGNTNLYIFKYNPTITFTADDGGTREEGTSIDPVGYTYQNEMDGKFQNAFLDGYNVLFMNREGMKDATTVAYKELADGTLDKSTDGYSDQAKAGDYKTLMANYKAAEKWGYTVKDESGKLVITAKAEPEPDPEPTPNPEPTPTPEPTPSPEPTPTPGPTPNPTPTSGPEPASVTERPAETRSYNVNLVEKPQVDSLSTSNLAGTAFYTTQMAQGASADRVLGLQSAELPFFNKKNGVVKLYGTYDVTVDPDKVKMEPTAKVLPEPEQEQARAQYREYDKELTTAAGTAKFRLTYNGTTLDIHPTDAASMAILTAGDGTKNVEVESQALFAAFNEMGITLDDLDGVYTHFEKA